MFYAKEKFLKKYCEVTWDSYSYSREKTTQPVHLKLATLGLIHICRFSSSIINIIINIMMIMIIIIISMMIIDKKRQQIYVLAEAKCERSILCLLRCTPTQMPTNTKYIFIIIIIIIITNIVVAIMIPIFITMTIIYSSCPPIITSSSSLPALNTSTDQFKQIIYRLSMIVSDILRASTMTFTMTISTTMVIIVLTLRFPALYGGH